MSIISTILGVESFGGQNVTQSLGTKDVNNNYGAGGGTPAQGYFQIIDPTWNAYGGASTGYSSAIQAPYSVQLQVAQNIPVNQWGPSTVNALHAAGYQWSGNTTLGQLLQNYGENPTATIPADGSSPTGTSVASNNTPSDGGGSASTQPAVEPDGPSDETAGGDNATGWSLTEDPNGQSEFSSGASVGDQYSPLSASQNYGGLGYPALSGNSAQTATDNSGSNLLGYGNASATDANNQPYNPTTAQVPGLNQSPSSAVSGLPSAPQGNATAAGSGTPINVTDPNAIAQSGLNAVAKSNTQVGADIIQAAGNLTASGTNWLDSIYSVVENFSISVGLVILGLVLLIGAFWFFSIENNKGGGATIVPVPV